MKKILLSLMMLAVVGIINAATSNVQTTVYYGGFYTSGNQEVSYGTLFVEAWDLQPGELASILTATKEDSKNQDAWQLFKDYENVKISSTSSLNDADLAALENFTNIVKLDLDNATLAEGASISNLKTSAQYISLPDDITEIDANTLPNCPNLKAAVSLKDKALAGYVKSANNPGALRRALELFPGKAFQNQYNYNVGGNITKVKLTGELTAADITQGSLVNAFNETLISQDVINSIKYYNSDGSVGTWAALNGASLTDIDLSGAYFPNQTDMSLLYAYGPNGLANVKLPLDARQTILPAGTFDNCPSLTSLCIPVNFEEIQNRSISGATTHITTTDANSYDDEHIIDNGALSITLSSNLKTIRTGAFSNVTGVKDVYVLATTAPVCEINAFSSVSYCGNNTINSVEGAVTRDSYKCGEGWVAQLHFPNTCDKTNILRYTDVTRDFSIATGEKDGNGNLIMFPNQSELNRAETQSMAGYIWTDCDVNRQPYRSDNTAFPLQLGAFDYTSAGDDVATIQTKMKELYDNYTGSLQDANMNVINTAAPLVTKASKTTSYDLNYIGWHQFLLANYTLPEDPEFTYNFGGIWDNEWWTICVPLELTKAQVNQYFGGNENNEIVRVCEFVGVDRIQDTKIVLRFGSNLMADETKGDNDVIIKAGHPYMIKPNLKADYSDQSRIMRIPVDALSEQMKIYNEMDQAAMMALVKNNVVVVQPEDIRLWDDLASYEAGNDPVATSATDTDKAHDNGLNAPFKNYAFVGTFWKYHMPQYSYFLGYGNGKVQYFWKNDAVDIATRSWNTCTAIILPNWDTTATPVEPRSGLETVHWDFIPAASTSTYSFSQSDAYKTWAELQSANVEMFFEGETDGIQKVHTDNGVVTSVSGTIYNLNGQVVARKGNTSNLSKGVYVVGGKKFIVK